MSETMFIALVSAGSALMGALIGGAASAVTTWVQQRAETRRSFARLSAEIELESMKMIIPIAAQGTAVNLGSSVPAIVSNFKLLEALAKHGPDSPEVRTLIAEATAAGESGQKK